MTLMQQRLENEQQKVALQREALAEYEKIVAAQRETIDQLRQVIATLANPKERIYAPGEKPIYDTRRSTI